LNTVRNYLYGEKTDRKMLFVGKGFGHKAPGSTTNISSCILMPLLPVALKREQNVCSSLAP